MAHIEAREIAHVRSVAAALEGREADARGLIIESWKRCATRFRLDPTRRSDTRVLTRRELVEFRDPMAPLIRIARPILEDLYRALEPAGYCILFTDLNGVAIDYLTSPSLDDDNRAAGLILGAVWSEAAEGTNGVGTCIVTERLLTVHRTDHFRAKNAGLSCTCAPVFDPDGRLAAVLDVSTARPDGGSVRFAEHLVERTSRRLANAWFRERHRDRWVLRLFPDAESLDPTEEGLVAIDAEGAIVGMTAEARRLLRDGTADDTEQPARAAARLAKLARPGGGPRRLDGTRPLFLIPVEPASGRRSPASLAEPAPPPAVALARRVQPTGTAGPSPLDRLAGREPSLVAAVQLARLAKQGAVPVLVTGESGTGKSAFAAALAGDGAAAMPLAVVDVAGLDAETVTARFEAALASGGGVVLDEIGEASEPARQAVLSVLRRHEAEAGTTMPLLVSTTRLAPAALMARLRPELYFRLAGAVVTLLPLRQRADRETVVETTLSAVAAELGRPEPDIGPRALAALASASWPGNLRELAATLRLALLAAGDGPLDLADLPPLPGASEAVGGTATTAGGLGRHAALMADGPAARAPAASGPIVEQAVDDLERLLVAHHWCVSKVARVLAVDRSTIHRRMNRFGLVPPQRRE